MTELFEVAESQQRQLEVLYEKVAELTTKNDIQWKRIDELTAQRDKVLALHQEFDDVCNSRTWPCETARAYGVEP